MKRRRGPRAAAAAPVTTAATAPAAVPALARDPRTVYPIRGPAYVTATRPPLPRDLTDLVAKRGAAPVLELLEELATFPPWRRCSRPGCGASTRGEFCPRHRP